MGKKAAVQAPSKRKQKHKEMFTQLATHQQQMVEEERRSRPHPFKRTIAEDSQEDVQLQILQHENKNLDAICQTVHRLLSKNKVSAKNAFEVPLIDLERLPDFTDSLENQYAWKRLSSTLESDYKIYGYRVDAIHSITYNMLNTMARRQQDIDSLQQPPQTKAKQMEIQPMRNDQGNEGEYLQKKISNINFSELELVTRMDPILERTKRQFDQLGQQSLMLDTLPIDNMLGLQLICQNNIMIKHPQWGKYTDEWQVQQPLLAFEQLASFRSQLREEYGGRIIEDNMHEILQSQIDHLLVSDKQNYYTGNQPQFDMLSDRKKSIREQINFKYPFYRNERDIAEDADRWMGQIDRKFLGLPSKKYQKSEIGTKVEVKQQDPADLIDFERQMGSLTRNEVFRPDQQKGEHHQDVEDRFLLAMNMTMPLDIKKYPVFIREEPEIQQQDCNYQLQEQVDIRRQNISIMESKRKIKQKIHQRSTFLQIYKSYAVEHQVSPALCFLTLLHLANEQHLQLNEINDYNFSISY